MGDMIYRPLIEGMRWSYSRLHSFEQCRYGWFLKYIHGTKKEEKFYASYGSFVHKLIELYYRGFFTAMELKGAFVTGFSDSVLGIRPNDSIVTKYIAAGIRYFKDFRPVPFHVLEVEKKIQFEMDGIPMVAIIDILGEENGGLIIVDNKSRDLKPRSHREKPTVNDKVLDEMLRQLYIYACAVKAEYGRFPSALCFNCFKAGVFIREPFQKEKYDEAIQWAKDRIEEIKSEEDFDPNPEYFFCKFLCDVSYDCIYKDMS